MKCVSHYLKVLEICFIDPWLPYFSLYFQFICFSFIMNLHVFILAVVILCCGYPLGSAKEFINLTVVYSDLGAIQL